jgi:site-specific DNA recombinase
MLSCSSCGNKLTSSSSKGRNKYYQYYHCRLGCKERIPVSTAHEMMFKYFEQIKVAPEIAELYMEVMKTIFKSNEHDNEMEAKKHKDKLLNAEKKLASLEEKYVMNEIEKDSYLLMKPKFKEEIAVIKQKKGGGSKCRAKLY